MYIQIIIQLLSTNLPNVTLLFLFFYFVAYVTFIFIYPTIFCHLLQIIGGLWENVIV